MQVAKVDMGNDDDADDDADDDSDDDGVKDDDEMGKTCNVMIADSRLQSKNADCNGDGNADDFIKRNFYDFSGIHYHQS